MTGNAPCPAASTSTWPLGIAALTTTARASPTLLRGVSLEDPGALRDQVCGARDVQVRAADRESPLQSAITASALIPAPPIPTKCSGRGSEGRKRFMADDLM